MLRLPIKIHRINRQNINIRYKVHIQAIRNSNSNSVYSNHILNTGHTYGSITDTMDIIQTEKKGKHLNGLERYHICKIYTYFDIYNPIFENLH
jgi:hypothetical protein